MILKSYDFQNDAVDWLIDTSLRVDSKQTMVMRAPTGAGKTIILIKFIDKLLTVDKNVAVVWLCPGKGDLEEQSRDRMRQYLPSKHTYDLFDALTNGFEAGSTTFINWERVTKKGNRAITDSEFNNLYDNIRIAQNRGTQFYLIIDEEHSNNTSKANDLLRYFGAKHTIRVSATTISNRSSVEYYEIDEQDVIDEGLITSAICVNEGIENDSAQDDIVLLDLADKKRKAILEAYGKLDKRIRPLVLIQFPNGEPEKIKAIEEKLASMGYTRENGMVAAWLSGDKADIPEDLTQNESQLSFLFIKQAINTGWDCPRAKILVKLRENSSEAFQIQTIGRIRRMPEGHHYEIPLLDMCYVYTFDSDYHAGLMAGLEKAYVPRRLFLKEECKELQLPKELKDMDGGTVDFRFVYSLIYNHFVEKYKLDKNSANNIEKLKGQGYHFYNYLEGSIRGGIFVRSDDMLEGGTSITTRTPVDTHEHAIQLRQIIDSFKSILGIQYENARAIMDRLFCFKYKNRDKLFALGMKEYYAFIINNQHLIREELRAVTSQVTVQRRLLQPKVSTFTIPLEELYHYDPSERKPELLERNAYEEYTSAYVTAACGKSEPEIMFEYYCNDSDNVEWFYKNGDSGQDYLSIVYTDALSKQKSFYPDYVVKLKDGTVWIIESKGGQKGNVDQNIDKQVFNKFEAFKRYAEDYGIKWGFVRPMNTKLFLNNTEYVTDMHDEKWQKLSNYF